MRPTRLLALLLVDGTHAAAMLSMGRRIRIATVREVCDQQDGRVDGGRHRGARALRKICE